MGKEIICNSIEEMCDLMCNNKLPKRYEDGIEDDLPWDEGNPDYWEDED